jgi:hypothetical protein
MLLALSSNGYIGIIHFNICVFYNVVVKHGSYIWPLFSHCVIMYETRITIAYMEVCEFRIASHEAYLNLVHTVKIQTIL